MDFKCNKRESERGKKSEKRIKKKITHQITTQWISFLVYLCEIFMDDFFPFWLFTIKKDHTVRHSVLCKFYHEVFRLLESYTVLNTSNFTLLLARKQKRNKKIKIKIGGHINGAYPNRMNNIHPTFSVTMSMCTLRATERTKDSKWRRHENHNFFPPRNGCTVGDYSSVSDTCLV